jgi:hypothetical protein
VTEEASEAKTEVMAAVRPPTAEETEVVAAVKAAFEPVNGTEPVAADNTATQVLAPVMPPPDDTPTMIGEIPAIVTVVDDAGENAGGDGGYVGNRRVGGPPRRYPVGAIAVVAVIVLVLLGIAYQLVGGSDSRHETAGSPVGLPTASLPALVSPSLSDAPLSPSPSVPPSPTPVSPAAAGGAHAKSSPSPTGGASSAPAGPPPPASTSASPRFAIPQNALISATGRCVEVTRTEQQARLVTCDNNDPGQRWSSVAGTLRSLNACLDVRGAATNAGTVVQLYGCNNTAAQQWEVRGDGTVRNPHSGKCLDANGGNLVIQNCGRSWDQIWKLT